MRLLRPRGRTAFFTGHVTPGLSKRDYRRASVPGLGPSPHAGTIDRSWRRPGSSKSRRGTSPTSSLATAERWVQFSRQLEPELRALQGAEAFDEVQLDRETILGAIREGLLSRSLFVAARP